MSALCSNADHLEHSPDGGDYNSERIATIAMGSPGLWRSLPSSQPHLHARPLPPPACIGSTAVLRCAARRWAVPSLELTHRFCDVRLVKVGRNGEADGGGRQCGRPIHDHAWWVRGS